MKPRIIKRRYSDLTKEECDQMILLTYGDAGDMMNVLTHRAKANPAPYRFYLLKTPGIVWGWALLTRNPRATEGFEIDIFVREDSRRQGYGTQLIEAVKKDIPKQIDVYPCDSVGQRFFEALGLFERNIEDWVPVS